MRDNREKRWQVPARRAAFAEIARIDRDFPLPPRHDWSGGPVTFMPGTGGMI